MVVDPWRREADPPPWWWRRSVEIRGEREGGSCGASGPRKEVLDLVVTGSAREKRRGAAWWRRLSRTKPSKDPALLSLSLDLGLGFLGLAWLEEEGGEGAVAGWFQNK